MEKVRWGILSTAKIGRKDVIPAIQQGDYSEVAAIASRNLEKAKEVAKSLDIKKAVGSYEELLELPEVDAIYNPLPNHLHVPWSIKALRAGKHVLCEKPIGLTFEDALKLKTEADSHSGLKVMEAFMYRHHPRWAKAKELVDEGVLGELKSVHCIFSYFNDDPDNIRNKPEMGGGSLMDIGCYCISVPRFLFGEEPARVFGTMEVDPDLQVDRLTSGMLEFVEAEGRATFTCGTQMVRHQSVSILGTRGRMEIPEPFNPPADRATLLRLWNEEGKEEISFDPCNQYTLQGDLFSKAILEDSEVPSGLDDALSNMKVMDAIVESQSKGNWIQV